MGELGHRRAASVPARLPGQSTTFARSIIWVFSCICRRRGAIKKNMNFGSVGFSDSVEMASVHRGQGQPVRETLHRRAVCDKVI